MAMIPTSSYGRDVNYQLPSPQAGGVGPYQSQLQQPSYGNYATTSTASDIGGSVSNVGEGVTTAGADTGNPYLAGGGLALQAVGTGLDFYGKYQARDEADRRYKDAMAQYQEQLRVEQEDRAREAQRQQRQENYFGADYSQQLEDRFAGQYGGYRQGGQ